MSTGRITLRLREAQQAHAAMAQAWSHVKSWLVCSGGTLVLEVKPETRSSKQNNFLHAMLGDIAAQIEWAGKKRDGEVWKRLLTAAWCRARREQIELLPALDGHGVDIVFRRTSQLTRAECAELCDFISAWAIENGVIFRDSQQWIDETTGEIHDSK